MFTRTILLALTLAALSLQANVNKDLEEAYKKEYAFLVAQKKALEERLASVKAEAKTKIGSAERTIAKLQDSYIAKSTRAEQKAQQLLEAERDAQSIQDSSNLVDATLLQAGSTLEKYGYTKQPDKAESLTKLEALYSFGAKALGELDTTRKEAGSFYLADGSKVEGTIVKVGNVAAYGLSESHKGALAPAGEGHYKLWQQPVGDFMGQLKRDEVSGIDIFLYETLDKEIEAPQEKTVLGVIQSGGVVAWVIVVMGVFALGLVALRVRFLKNASASTDRVTYDVSRIIAQGDRNEALEKCGQYKNATSRVLAATIRNLERDREHLEDIISESILHENAHLDRFGSMIIIIAAVAPLMGLLGTVTGMISTFDIITEFGTGDPKLLSGGISEALVTTELGLIVAIPALIFGNMLSGWAENIKDDMEKAALKVTNTYKKATEA